MSKLPLNRILRASLAAVALACVPFDAAAVPDLDPAFGGTGVVIGPVNPPGTTSFANEGLAADRHEAAVFLRSINDGVTQTMAVVRILNTGVVDAGFGTTGAAPVVTMAPDFIYSALAIDASRRILVAYGTGGGTAFNVLRFSETGIADAGFGTGGTATIPALNSYAVIDVMAQPDGKVLVVSSTGSDPLNPLLGQITLYRLTAAGVLDPTFGTGGVVYTTVPGSTGVDRGTGLGLQPDGKILVAGRSQRSPSEADGVVVRYLTNGALDPAFGVGGIAVVSFGPALRAQTRRLALQPDGKIVAVGTVSDAAGIGSAGLFRLNANGSLDVGFGSAGTNRIALGANGGAIYEVVLQPDGRPVLGGLRYRSPGSLDLIATLDRYTAFGTLDTTWDGDGLYELLPAPFTESNTSSIAIDDHDRILLAGSVNTTTETRWMVARLTTGPKMVCKP